MSRPGAHSCSVRKQKWLCLLKGARSSVAEEATGRRHPRDAAGPKGSGKFDEVDYFYCCCETEKKAAERAGGPLSVPGSGE